MGRGCSRVPGLAQRVAEKADHREEQNQHRDEDNWGCPFTFRLEHEGKADFQLPPVLLARFRDHRSSSRSMSVQRSMLNSAWAWMSL